MVRDRPTDRMRLRAPEALTRARQHAGITQRALADEIGVSNGTIGDLETGRRTTVSAATARAITRALGCAEVRLFASDPRRMYPRHPDEFWRARNATGLFQTQVAAAAGCSKDTIMRLEHGQVGWVGTPVAEAIARALDVDTSRLFTATLSSLSDNIRQRGETAGRVA